MQSNYWDNFYQTGKVADNLKYVDSARNTAEETGDYTKKDTFSNSMESMKYAGKGDGNGAVGHAGW